MLTIGFRSPRAARAVLVSSVLAIASIAAVSPALAQERGVEDGRCVIWFRLIDDISLTNVGFDTDYSGASGDIDGAYQDAVCARAIGGSLAAFRDKEDIRVLRSAVIRVSPFDGPIDLAACRFVYNGEPPVPGDFDVTVTDAGRQGSVPGTVEDVEPLPRVRVSRVECPGQLPGGLTTTTTTSTTTTDTSTTSSLPLDSSTTTVPAGGERCGFPQSDGERPTATDALYVLQTSVALRTCALCVCDIDDSGLIVASDALATLRASVGLPTDLDCPACA